MSTEIARSTDRLVTLVYQNFWYKVLVQVSPWVYNYGSTRNRAIAERMFLDAASKPRMVG